MNVRQNITLEMNIPLSQHAFFNTPLKSISFTHSRERRTWRKRGYVGLKKKKKKKTVSFVNHKREALWIVVTYYAAFFKTRFLNAGREISNALGSHRQHQIFMLWRWSLLINSSIKLKNSGVTASQKKACNITWGYREVWKPAGRLKLRQRLVLCFIDSSPGVWKQ